MSVLVTGGAGYIGGHMVLALLDAGETVVVLDNLSTGFRWAVPPEAVFIEGDFGDEALVASIIAEHEVDAIAHFAARIVVPESVTEPLGYYLNNTAKARTLIQTVVEAGVKTFIFRRRRPSTASRPRAGDGGYSTRADQSLRPLEADGRVDAGRHAESARSPRRRAAILQRRRCRSCGASRPIDAERDPPHQDRRPGRTRTSQRDGRVRHGLCDPGRVVRARLHPDFRPDRRAHACVGDISARAERA